MWYQVHFQKFKETINDLHGFPTASNLSSHYKAKRGEERFTKKNLLWGTCISLHLSLHHWNLSQHTKSAVTIQLQTQHIWLVMKRQTSRLAQSVKRRLSRIRGDPRHPLFAVPTITFSLIVAGKTLMQVHCFAGIHRACSEPVHWNRLPKDAVDAPSLVGDPARSRGLKLDGHCGSFQSRPFYDCYHFYQEQLKAHSAKKSLQKLGS